MKKVFLATAVAATFIACQKSTKPSENQPPDQSKPQGSSNLLTKIVDSNMNGGGVYDIDSVMYSYDAAGKLSKVVFYDSAADHVTHNITSYTRDEQGRTTMIYENDFFLQITSSPKPSDTARNVFTSEVYYQSGSDQIAYVYRWSAQAGRPVGDSIVYEYESGSIVATNNYTTTFGKSSQHVNTNSYAFNPAGELTAMSTNTQDPQIQADYTFTFDGKTNPLKAGLEELFSNFYNVCPDNETRWGFTFPSNGDSFGLEMSFTYREDGRPLTRTYLNGSEKSLFFYQ